MFRTITNAADPEMAPYRRVGDAPALERDGLFVAEGRLVVERLLADRRFRVHSAAVTPAAAAALAGVFEGRPEIPVHVCDPGVLEAVTGFDFHRGCLALAWRDAPVPPLDALTRVPRLLALEGVGNPDNIGGLFRAALAFDVGAVLLDPSTADPLYRKAIRTSMGATLRVPFLRVPQWPSGLDAMRDHGCRILALTPHADAFPLDQLRVSPDDRLVLAVGSEGSGLSDELLRYADERVRIPVNLRADSLNVVVAAGIALHALSAGESR